MLVGKRVILEEIDPRNVEQLRVWRNQLDLRMYFREYKDITKDMQNKWYSERGNNSNPKFIYFQIMSKDLSALGEYNKIANRFLVGCCGALNIDYRLRSCELSIFLATEYHGRGLGKEALELLMKYVFEELNAHKFWGECYDSNNAIEIYKKVGFKVDGVTRDSWYHCGKYGNSYMFSMLENEWKELYCGKESK